MAVSITLKGREIPLLYTTFELKQMQEEIAPLGKLNYAIFGRNPEDETDTSRYATPDHLEAVAKMIRILGNAGLEEAGQKPDLTEKWIMRAIKPERLAEVAVKCSEAMDEGWKSEIPEEKKEGRVDVTLEKLNKKKEKES
jgi:hypothetical protein